MIRRALCLIALCAAALLPSAPRALNPIIQTMYSTDPAPVVFGDRVYVYTGHDEDGATTGFVMKNWWVFSSADMVNWTAHGSPLSLQSFPWAARDAWAGQCISRVVKQRDGSTKTQYFWYVPVRNAGGATEIGVAVSDSPTGPFTNATGDKPLVANAAIDPTVFIDDDEQQQAYLYYGNPGLFFVKLNPDMISVSEGPTQVRLDATNSGFRVDGKNVFTEGPWFYKRNGLYYMIFSTPIPEFIAYSTSPNPTGPWTYRGIIMANRSPSFTSHVGVVDFKGKSYIFYHNAELTGGSGYQRSVAVESLTYGEDGSIRLIAQTPDGVPPDPAATLDPYSRVEAETIAWEQGVELEDTTDEGGGMDVTDISNGDSIRVMNVDFGAGATSFDARVASDSAGGKIELRLDTADGTLVGTCVVPRTEGWQTWVTVSCKATGASGVHDLFLVFTGGSGSLFHFNWWRFNGVEGADTQAPTAPRGFTAGTPAAGSVSLSWGGATDDVRVLGYVVYRGTDTAVAVGTTSNPSIQLKGLTPTTTYQFTVRAFDAAGNLSDASAPVSVTTVADTNSPTTPGSLASSKLTETGVTLTWAASTDDVGVTGYVIYSSVGSGSPVQVGTTTDATTFAVTGLAPGTAYNLSVEATDAAGHHSTAAVTTVTTAGTASTPPSSGGGGGGGGCGQGSSAGLALPAFALCLVAIRRRRAAQRGAAAAR